MQAYVVLLIGVIGLVIAILNFTGRLLEIHTMGKRTVEEENLKPYGIIMGLGALALSAGLITSGILMLNGYDQKDWIPTIVLGVISIVIMSIGQYKYSKFSA